MTEGINKTYRACKFCRFFLFGKCRTPATTFRSVVVGVHGWAVGIESVGVGDLDLLDDPPLSCGSSGGVTAETIGAVGLLGHRIPVPKA
jgi:hypothetical protein